VEHTQTSAQLCQWKNLHWLDMVEVQQKVVKLCNNIVMYEYTGHVTNQSVCE